MRITQEEEDAFLCGGFGKIYNTHYAILYSMEHRKFVWKVRTVQNLLWKIM